MTTVTKFPGQCVTMTVLVGEGWKSVGTCTECSSTSCVYVDPCVIYEFHLQTVILNRLFVMQVLFNEET